MAESPITSSTSTDSIGTPSSPRRGGRPSRRDEVVRAAADTFAANGYHNTSLNDIAEQLSMTAAGILHHFGSKENLLTAVLQLRDADSKDNRVSDQDLLDHLIDTAERNQANPGLTQLYAVLSAESVTANHPAQDWFRDRYTTVRSDVTEALRLAAGLSDGELVEQVEQAARGLIAAMDGLQIQWLLNSDITMADSLSWMTEAAVAQLQRAATEG